MIRYEIKVFSKEGVYQTTINPNVIMNDISFSENTNGGQGQMNLDLALDFGDITFHGSEIIKVILYSERYKQGKQIYYGYVSQISRIYDINKGYIRLVCLGIGSLLTKILFTGDYEGTAEEILTEIIEKFNSEYEGDLITIGTIDPYEGSINVSLNQDTTCFKAIDKIREICDFFRFVDSEGRFIFKQKFSGTDHIVANQQAVERIELKYNIESMTNRLFLEMKDGTIQTYEDSTSQNLYGVKEKFMRQTSLNATQTQDDYGNSYINEYSMPKNASTIVVNSEYNIESILPGDTITIVNISYPVKNLLIEKITYTPNRITLTLEENESLRGVISS